MTRVHTTNRLWAWTLVERIALGIVVAAVGWSLLPAPVSVEPELPRVEPGPAATRSATGDGAAAVMSWANDARLLVERNPMSASRRAPRVRYMPPELATDMGAGVSSASIGGDGSAMGETGQASTPGAEFRLSGIVDVDGGRRALLRIGSDPARLVSGGERIGAWRVVAVERDRVVVDGPGGRRTVRLREALRDSARDLATDSLLPFFRDVP